MSPHYNRNAGDAESNVVQSEDGGGPEDDAMEDAAEALRQAEVEAVQPEASSIDPSLLEGMSIDELRKLAASLNIPDRGKITEQDELIAAIRERL